MAKVVLSDITSLANQLSAKQALNDNSQALRDAFDNTISRDGSGPNTMAADFDLNGHSLLNVADPVSDTDAVNKRSIGPLVDAFVSLIAKTLIEGTARVEQFTATAAQTEFPLIDSPGTTKNMYVFDDGVALIPDVDFTLTGTDLKTLEFFVGRTVSHTIIVRYTQLAPSDSVLRGDLLSAAVGKGTALLSFTPGSVGALTRGLHGKLDETISVLDYIPEEEHAAILAGTSTYDATAGVQAAITAAILGRRKLSAPGHYRTTAPINVTGAMTLDGDGCEMQVADLGSVQQRGKGSWFHIDHAGAGFVLNDPTQYRSGITIKGIGTYRTQPDTTAGSFTPTAFGFDFEVKRCDALLEDICIYNATNGIKHYTGGYGRLQVNRLRGQPLLVGVQVDDSADTCRFRDIHFWPFFSNSASVRTHLRANAKAMVLKDVDNPDISGFFTLGYADSLACEPLAGTLAMPLKVRLSNFDFDNGGAGIRIASGGANGVTMLVSHGYVLGVSVGGPANYSNIDIAGNNNVVMIDNVGMDLPQDACLKVTGTGNVLRGSNWSVGRWNYDAGASFGIDVAAGNTLRLANPPIITQAGTSTAVFGGAGVISCPLGSGVTTATTDGSGFITVTHGLGIAPRSVVATCQSGTAYMPFPTTSKNTTTLGIQFRLASTGAVVASTSITVEWSAWY